MIAALKEVGEWGLATHTWPFGPCIAMPCASSRRALDRAQVPTRVGTKDAKEGLA